LRLDLQTFHLLWQQAPAAGDFLRSDSAVMFHSLFCSSTVIDLLSYFSYEPKVGVTLTLLSRWKHLSGEFSKVFLILFAYLQSKFETGRLFFGCVLSISHNLSCKNRKTFLVANYSQQIFFYQTCSFLPPNYRTFSN
jgi:hypothetical protein